LEFLYLAARGHRHLWNDFEIFRQILASQLVGLKVSYHFGKVEALVGSSAVGISSWRAMASERLDAPTVMLPLASGKFGNSRSVKWCDKPSFRLLIPLVTRMFP
jgi:hypothetical protein